MPQFMVGVGNVRLCALVDVAIPPVLEGGHEVAGTVALISEGNEFRGFEVLSEELAGLVGALSERDRESLLVAIHDGARKLLVEVAHRRGIKTEGED